MGGKKQTIGYHYLFTILFGLCRGPINEMKAIRVGDKEAFGGHLCSGTGTPINKPSLFGGEKKEGGIQGAFNLNMGAIDQVLPGPIVVTGIGYTGPVKSTRLMDARTILPGKVSQLRGIVTVLYDGLVSSINPYPKEWKFRVARTTAGWSRETWYPGKATIWMGTFTWVDSVQAQSLSPLQMIAWMMLGGSPTKAVKLQVESTVWGANGAHIVYEALTDQDWGGSEDPAEIDENSFIVAANTLCAEGFGLCLKWERSEDVDVFIKRVMDHVGGTLYVDRQTGLYTMKLLRGDYVVADLPLFTPDSGLLEITEDDSEATSDAINEVIATGIDPEDGGNEFQVRVQNNAAIQALGGRVTNSVKYEGIPTRELLTRVAQRDLKASSVGLKRFTLKMDRRAWRIYPGMPFRIQDPRRGLAQIVVRAGEIDDRTDMQDGVITIKVVEDVFSMPETSFVDVSQPGWTPPPENALPSPEERAYEAGYRDIYLKRGQADVDAMFPTDALLGVVAASPFSSMTEFDLATRVLPDDYEVRGTGFFTDYGLTVDALGFYDTILKLDNLTPGFEPDEVVGTALLIGDEVVGVDSYDPVEDEYTISRGAADTIPQEHAAGVRAWTIDDDTATDEVLYQTGDVVNAKVLTKTATDTLDAGVADELTITMVGRQYRPYPPADVRVDGDLVFELGGLHNEPVISWNHRDRKMQFDSLIDTREASIGPETGTTYNVRVFSYPADVMIREETGIVGDTWTYDASMITADNPTPTVRVELESEREEVTSWQKYSFLVRLTGGYGNGYGLNYGGA